MNNKSNPWSLVLKCLRQSWQQILVTHLIFMALGVVLFAPLIGFTGRLLLKLSGQTALADQDIAYFLLSPIGMLALILFAALLIGILAFEQAILIRIAISVMHGKSVRTVDALEYTASRIHSVFMFTGRLVIRVLLLTLPFLAVAAGIALFLMSEYDINYYLTEKPPELWTAAVLIAVILMTMTFLLVRKLLGWFLALPLVLFANVSPARSFDESTRITKGNRTQVLALLVSWGILAILLTGIVFGVIQLAGSWLIPSFIGSISILVLLLGGLSLAWMLGNFLLTTFTSGVFAYLVMGLYEEHALPWI